ncbi:MAG: dethiobiotin synthase, partial [Ignavibacteria bacterium]|nr:dethiobiotin synthase [Ignavibacteria bacterium]
MVRRIFVAGIGTGVGKTVVSAILVEAMRADYWKPIQAGDLDSSDTKTVQQLISNTVSRFHPEVYRLTKSLSPHAAAAVDNVTVDLQAICSSLPITRNRHLIIEGAGGVMSPVSDSSVV